MTQTAKKVMTAHVPSELAARIDQKAVQLDRSRGWIILQALVNWLKQEEEYERLTRQALTDVDHGHVIPQKDVEAWADRLNSENSLKIPR